MRQVIVIDFSLEKLIQVSQLLLYSFLEPTERLFWMYLLGALCISILMGIRHKKNITWSSLFNYVFQSRTWQHPSSLLDYKIFISKIWIRLIFGGSSLMTSWGIAVWVTQFCNQVFSGYPNFSLPHMTIMILYTFTLFMLWDLSRFLTHLAFHRISFLWEFHKVHHSATVLTPMTLYRTHPIEAMFFRLQSVLVTGCLSGLFFYLFQERARTLDILGINVFGFIFSLLGSNLRHSHIMLSYGKTLEKYLISPAQHQLHHSLLLKHQETNFGTWLSIWDRILGTLSIVNTKVSMKFGLPKKEINYDSTNLLATLWQPCFASFKKLQYLLENRVYNILKVLFIVILFLPFPTFSQQEIKKTRSKPDKQISTSKRKEQNNVVQKIDYTLDTISIISGSRVTGAAHTLSEKDLNKFKSNDIQRILKRVPAVYVRGEDGYGLRPNIGIRGVSSDRSAKTTLMEDGVLFAPAPYSAPAAYYFPMLGRISGIEVFKGPASIKYGPNTIGGAINLQTRSLPHYPVISADIAGGDEKTLKAHSYTGLGNQNWVIFVEGLHLRANGFKQLDGDGNTGFHKSEILAHTRYQTDIRKSMFHQFDFRVGYGQEQSNETYLGLSDEDFIDTPYRRYFASQLDVLTWNRIHLRLDYLFVLSRVLKLHTTLYRNTFERSWRRLNAFKNGPTLHAILSNPTFGQNAVFYNILRGQENTNNDNQALEIVNNARNYVSQGIQTNSVWSLNAYSIKQDIEVGLRYHNDYVRRQHTGVEYQVNQKNLVRNTTVPEQNLTDNQGLTHAIALYVHDKITYKNFLIAPGVRYEHIITSLTNYIDNNKNTSQKRYVIMPGVGINYQISHWLEILADLHRGFSPVSPGQTSDIQAENSLNYEAGSRMAYHTTKWELIGFFNNYTNLTGECTFSAGCNQSQINQQFNAGKVYVYGFETMLSQNFKAPMQLDFSIKVIYSLTFSRFRTNFSSPNPQLLNVSVGDELPYVPKHQGSLLLGMDLSDRWSLNISIGYVGNTRDVAGQGDIPNNQLIARHAVVDLASSVRVFMEGHAYISIKNLLNTHYIVSRRPFGVRPGRPFQILAGYKMLFTLQKNNPLESYTQ